MPNIKPVSDLRNYNQVLHDIATGEPVFLTKNGRGKYVMIDIVDYQREQAKLELLTKLVESEDAIKTGAEWISNEDVKKSLGI